jgi:hypothetical protein
MRIIWKLALSLTISLLALSNAQATDIRGIVSSMQIKPGSDQLWFSIAPLYGANVSLYCQAGWAGLTMYVPTTDPDYPYYYGLLLTSLTKNISIYLANISFYSNSPACDVTKTGYGVLLLNN